MSAHRLVNHSRRFWPLWLVAGLLSAAFVVLACLSRLAPGLQTWDQHVTGVFIGWRSARWSRALWIFTLIGDDPVMALLSAAVVVPLAVWGKRGRAAAGALGLIIAWLVMTLTKALVGRERPPQSEALIHRPVSHSMPSGHALVSAVFVGLLAYLVFMWMADRRRRGKSSLAWAVALKSGAVLAAAATTGFVGISRVYLGVHWMSDVIAGWCLGGSLLCATLWLATGWQRDGGPRGLLRDTAPLVGRRRRVCIAAGLAVLVCAVTVVTALVDPLQ